MLKNLIKITYRNFLRNKAHSAINILGLALGLATCIIIFLYVQDEMSYDTFHLNKDRIYRMQSQYQASDGDSHWAATQAYMIPFLVDRFPEIEKGLRIMPVRQPVILRYEDKQFREDGYIFADSTLFEVFSFPFLQGNPKTALDAPNKIVITAATAHKYFGEEAAIGKILQTDNSSYTVSGVIEDLPARSHLHFDMVVPMSDLATRWPGVNQAESGPSVMYSYIMLQNTEVKQQFQQKLGREIYAFYGFDISQDSSNIPEDVNISLFMNPLTHIHLNGNAEKEMASNNEWKYIYIFSTIALFILLIACINYMNLATARSIRRAREVGVRKVLGAYRSHIFSQFIGESLFFSILAMCVACMLVSLVLPFFSDWVGKDLSLQVWGNPLLAIALASITLFVGIFSGIYPAFFLAGFNPLKVLKANSASISGQHSALNLRKVLVVVQFTISIFLIIGALVVYRQLNFIQNSDIGFDKEQIIVSSLPGRAAVEKIDVLKSELAEIPEVKAASGSSVIPGERVHIMSVRIPDLAGTQVSGENVDDGGRGMRIIGIDEDYAETMDLEIVAGRDLSKSFSTDARAGFLLNEAAIREFGFEENPIGRAFEYTYALDTPKVGTVIGVVKDFHYASLHAEVEPLMLHVWPQHFSFLSTRVDSDQMPETLRQIEEVWTSVLPGIPFDYFFLDDRYDQMYRTEMSMGTIITYFTGLALLIACLGLLGLASFVAQQRTREIGIRKVLGASVSDIVMLLSGNFTRLVLIACVPGLIAGWLVMSWWLEGFAYKENLGPGVFVIAVFMALAITWLTVSYQAWKAAKINPVSALKEE